MMQIPATDVDLSLFFKAFSYDVWRRIGFSQLTRRLAVSEVTITQNLVYNLHLLSKEHRFPIKIYESTNEKVNGNDLEILLETKKGVLKIPCQAKIIGKSGRFNRLNHTVKGQFQIDSLINYAQQTGGYPCYLFYNHYEKGDMNKVEEMLRPVKEFWGCSIGSAFYVKNLCNKTGRFKNPSFSDLHPQICKPFYQLAECIVPKFSIRKLCQLFNDIDMNQVILYSAGEVFYEPGWVDLTPRSGLGYITPEVLDLKRSKRSIYLSENIFRPQFRIFLTMKKYSAVTIKMLT
jgi:hypothetical protein